MTLADCDHLTARTPGPVGSSDGSFIPVVSFNMSHHMSGPEKKYTTFTLLVMIYLSTPTGKYFGSIESIKTSETIVWYDSRLFVLHPPVS